MEHVLIYIYLLSFLTLAIYGMHRSSMLVRLAFRPYKQEELPEITEFPKVCVQLPVFNEPKVIERLIRSVSKLEYPSDKLEIQILDDSNDQTTEIIKTVLSQLGNPSHIKLVRRPDREGYKAGALQYGLNHTDAELVAIFDADFIPDADFLKRTIPYFIKPDLAYVQARWTYVNRFKNLLTRAQAILIDPHFMIEHPCRSKFAHFNFNGTAGVWRKSAIIDAGGWQHDTITEDLDLSYRAALKKWKAIYLRDVLCKSELPEDVNAFKSQQYRWMKGSAQVFKKLIWRIFKSDLPLVYKFEAFFHLSANFCYQLMLITALLVVPVAILRTSLNYSLGLWFEFVLFVLTLGSVLVFYYSAQRMQSRKVSARDIFLGTAVAVGIGAHCALASFAGLFASVGEFVRTPKNGSTDLLPKESICLPFLVGLKNVFSHRKESLIFIYLYTGLTYLFYLNYYLTIPFVLLIFSGYAIILYSAFCPHSYE